MRVKLHVATQDRNGLVNLDKLFPRQTPGSSEDFARYSISIVTSIFSFVCKTSNYTPSKKAAFCEDILKYLNLAGKSLLMDHCHSEDVQKSDPAWSSWHVKVRFDDIVYLYFKIVNIYMVVNSAIKGNWKHGAAHLTMLTQDANYRFSEDDSGKQSINVLENECHSW